MTGRREASCLQPALVGLTIREVIVPRPHFPHCDERAINKTTLHAVSAPRSAGKPGEPTDMQSKR